MLVVAIGLIMLFQEGEFLFMRRRRELDGKTPIEVSCSKSMFCDMSMSRHHTLLCIFSGTPIQSKRNTRVGPNRKMKS